jgi:hypothetical protein
VVNQLVSFIFGVKVKLLFFDFKLWEKLGVELRAADFEKFLDADAPFMLGILLFHYFRDLVGAQWWGTDFFGCVSQNLDHFI